MEKTVNIDFDASSSITLGYSADILYSGIPHWADSTHTHGGLCLYNLTGTSLSNGLTLSAADPAEAANALFAGSYISLVEAGVSTTVHVTGLQSAGDYLTTAADSTHSHGIAAATGMISGTISSGTNWSLMIPDFLLTAAESDHTHSEYLPTNYSTWTATAPWLTTAAPVTHIHGTVAGTNITIGSSSNGAEFSVADAMGTNTSLATITGTVPGLTGNTSGLTLELPNFVTDGNNLTLSGNTAGTLTLMNSGTLTIAGGNNITLSQDGNAFTIEGMGITATATGANAVHPGNYITLSTDGVNTTVSVTNLPIGSLNFGDSNGITFGGSIDGSSTTVTASYDSTHTHGSLSLDLLNLTGTYTSASDGLTLQLEADSGGGVGTGGVAIQGSGTYIQDAGTVQFMNSNGITFGLVSDSMTASHNAFYETSQLSSYFADFFHTHSNLYINISNSTLFAITDHSHGPLYLTNIDGTSQSDALSLSIDVGSLYFDNLLNTNLTWYSSEDGLSTTIYASAEGGTTYGTGVGGGIAITASGNTDGTLALISSGTMTLAGSDGITLSQSGNRIDIVGEQGYVFFTDGSNVTWDSSVSGNSTYIMLTAGGGTGTGGTTVERTDNIYLLGNTGTLSSAVFTGGDLALSLGWGLSGNIEQDTASTQINLQVAGSDIYESYSSAWGTGGGGVAVANTETTYTSGTVVLSGENLTINSSTGQHFQISAPPMGYLFFNDIAGFSFTTSIDGVSTTVGLSTA